MSVRPISRSESYFVVEPSKPIRKYLRISFINSLKTAFPNFLAFIKAVFHNIFSFKKKNGEWSKYQNGSIFELKGSSLTSNKPKVCLIKYNKSTSSSLIGTLADDVTSLVKAHLQNIGTSAKIVLLGHSMGGLVAVRAAIKLQKDYPNIRVVTVFSPHEGSNLLNIKKFNPKSTLDSNFHPSSPSFEGAAYAVIACTRFIAAKDHIIPRTKEEISELQKSGHLITGDGHNTFVLNPKTLKAIKQAALAENPDCLTHIFCIHGLNGTLGGLYPLAKALSN